MRAKTRMAKLNNGKLVHYDACADKRIVPSYRKAFRYIGKGAIFSINGVEQNRDKQRYFWEYKDRCKHLRSSLPY